MSKVRNYNTGKFQAQQTQRSGNFISQTGTDWYWAWPEVTVTVPEGLGGGLWRNREKHKSHASLQSGHYNDARMTIQIQNEHGYVYSLVLGQHRQALILFCTSTIQAETQAAIHYLIHYRFYGNTSFTGTSIVHSQHNLSLIMNRFKK